MGEKIKYQLFVIFCLAAVINTTSYAKEIKNLPNFGETVLQPKMRPEPTSKALFSLRTETLAPYLENILIFDSQEDFDSLPYVLGFASGLNMGSTGDTAYVAGINKSNNLSVYTLLGSGTMLTNPDTKETFGIEVHTIGSAELIELGEPQLLLITRAKSNLAVGSRLMPHVDLDLPSVIEARTPEKYITGRVISLAYRSVGAGHNTVVIIGLGEKDGLKLGNLLYAIDAPREIEDAPKKKQVSIKPKKFAEILIYKTMQRVSLGIVVSATRPILVNNYVASAENSY